MAWPAVRYALTQEQFRKYAQTLVWASWRPSLIVWHNTAAPSLVQWQKSSAQDIANGILPGTTRINNLENYFRYEKGWSGGPHLFIAPDYIWVFTLLIATGVHSPSWNSVSLGFEMVGDFSTENCDSGDGLLVKNNCVFSTAVLCGMIGLDPTKCIRLHKEDPKTTHDCPGKNMAVDKEVMIEDVQDLMGGGEHSVDRPEATDAPKEPDVTERRGVTKIGGLNFRSGPGIENESTGSLPNGTEVVILDGAINGSTEWLKVRTPAGYVGWVAGKFVQEL